MRDRETLALYGPGIEKSNEELFIGVGELTKYDALADENVWSFSLGVRFKNLWHWRGIEIDLFIFKILYSTDYRMDTTSWKVYKMWKRHNSNTMGSGYDL